MASHESDSIPKEIVPEITVQEIIAPEIGVPKPDVPDMPTKPAEENANFYLHAASLPSVIETESFDAFLDRFTMTDPPLMTSTDVLLLEDGHNKPILDDLKDHYARACALKIHKRTHYTQGAGTKDLPDELKSAHRLLLAGAVNNHFPTYNGMDERERKKWEAASTILIALRNVAFEMAGVETLTPTTALSKPTGSRTYPYQQDEPKSPRTPTLLGYGFGKEKDF